MNAISVAYDTRSGRIVAVNVGGSKTDAEPLGENVSEITIPANAVEPGKLYSVDVDRKVLVETKSYDGVGFGFGVSARFSSHSKS